MYVCMYVFMYVCIILRMSPQTMHIHNFNMSQWPWTKTFSWVMSRKAEIQQVYENLELHLKWLEVFVYDHWGILWKWSLTTFSSAEPGWSGLWLSRFSLKSSSVCRFKDNFHGWLHEGLLNGISYNLSTVLLILQVIKNIVHKWEKYEGGGGGRGSFLLHPPLDLSLESINHHFVLHAFIILKTVQPQPVY